MKRILAIINLIASIPVIVGAFGLAYIMFFAEPHEEPNVIGIIGGSEGPTEVFLTCEPEPLSVMVLGMYAGLFLLNGFVLFKNPGTTIHSTEPPSSVRSA